MFLGGCFGAIFGLADEVEVQPQFTLLQKTMGMAEGVACQLNPDANSGQSPVIWHQIGRKTNGFVKSA